MGKVIRIFGILPRAVDGDVKRLSESWQLLPALCDGLKKPHTNTKQFNMKTSKGIT